MNALADIPPFLDRRPFIGTYTILNAFRNCEHAMFRRYIKRDQPYVETEAIKFGNAAHAAMEKRIGQGIVLPENMREWEKYAEPFNQYDVKVEQQLGITADGKPTGYWDKDCWFRTKIDCTVLLNTKVLLTDWKTGNSKYEDPFELEINALCLKIHFPEISKAVGRYIYLKEDKIGQMHDLSNFERTWQQIAYYMTEIKNRREARIQEWEKKRSGLCGWCSVADCEHHKPRQ